MNAAARAGHQPGMRKGSWLVVALVACTGGSGGPHGGGLADGGGDARGAPDGGVAPDGAPVPDAPLPDAYIPVVCEGSFTIANSLDVMAIDECTDITGDIIINAAGLTNVTLPALRNIGGKLRVMPGATDLTTVSMPLLGTIGGDLEVNLVAQLSTLDLPMLTYAGNLYIGRSDQLMTLTGLHSLTTVAGNMTIWLDQLPSLAGLENLTTVGGYFNIFGDALTTLAPLAGVTTLGNLVVECDSLVSYDAFDAVVEVPGDMMLGDNLASSLTHFNAFGSLTTVGGYLSINGASLTALDAFENLTQVGQELLIQAPALTGLPELANVTTLGGLVVSSSGLPDFSDLASLATVSGQIVMQQNPALTSLAAFDSLTSAGSLKVYDCNALTELGFASLVTLTDPVGGLDIRQNDVLSQCEANELRDRLVAGGYVGNMDVCCICCTMPLCCNGTGTCP